MASLVTDKQGNHLVAFRWAGRQFTRSLGTRDTEAAKAAVASVNVILFRLKRNWLAIPPGVEPGAFIASGGTPTTSPNRAPSNAAVTPQRNHDPATREELRERFLQALRDAGPTKRGTLHALAYPGHRVAVVDQLAEELIREGLVRVETVQEYLLTPLGRRRAGESKGG